MWYRGCYSQRAGDNFSVVKLTRNEDIDNLSENQKFKHARNCDHLITPFECHICHFRIVQGGKPSGESQTDKQLLIAIHRANVDACWRRSEGEVSGNKLDMR